MNEKPRNDNLDDDPIEIANDDLLAAALLVEVPRRRDDYWASIDDRLAAPAVDTDIQPETREPVVDISVGANESGVLQRLRTWPVLAAAAALVLIAGLLTVRLLPSNGERVEAGFADGNNPAALEDLPGPTQNQDHWHAVYGVWDCTANDGSGDWLPAFQSTEDDVGIHSHQEGLIYIHPFNEESAGRNATFSHFADAMNFAITEDTITLEDGTVLAEGAMCNGEPAVIQMYRWQDDRTLRLNPTLPPRIITENFGAERFYNDYEVWTVALTSAGADVPLPPQDRLDELSLWWDPRDGTESLNQADLDQSNVEWAPPAHDTFTAVGRVGTGHEADAVVGQVIGWRSPDSPLVADGFVAGSGTRWMAQSSDTGAAVVIVEFEQDGLRPAPGDKSDEQRWACRGIALFEQQLIQSLSCSGSENHRERATALDYLSILPENPSVALTDAPDDAVWLVIETETGTRVLADVVDGLSFASWPSADGMWTRMDALAFDHTIVWSETCRLPTTMFCARS